MKKRWDKRRERGFTLAETLAAVGLLALTALPLMDLVTGSVRSTASLESRWLARSIAQNLLAEALEGETLPPVGVITGTALQMGREFRWEREIGPWDYEGVEQVIVRVSHPTSGQVLANLTTLRKVQP
jgi:general secretion pathway protein I